MAVVACQTCHLAAPMRPGRGDGGRHGGDRRAGTPATRYRNVERRPGEPLNAATIRPFRPLLVERVERDGVNRLAPVNPVSRFRWVSGAGPRRGALGHGVAGLPRGARPTPPPSWRPSTPTATARLDERELRLDSPAKIDAGGRPAGAAGVVRRRPSRGSSDPVPLAHGVPSRDRALRDCQGCHAGDSRLSEPFLIAGYLPGGTPPAPREGARVELAGLLEPGAGRRAGAVARPPRRRRAASTCWATPARG